MTVKSRLRAVSLNYRKLESPNKVPGIPTPRVQIAQLDATALRHFIACQGAVGCVRWASDNDDYQKRTASQCGDKYAER